MSTIDRYILRMLAMNYVIALVVLISLYLVLDLFFNIDEFTEQGSSAGQTLQNLGAYYGAYVFLYFSQISGIITLFAGMVTLARMRRLNELTALASSGVSLHRVTAIVLLFGVVTTAGLWWINAEQIIPSIASKLARRRDDPGGQRAYGVSFLHDREGALLSAQEYHPDRARLRRLLVLHRDAHGEFDAFVEAEEAEWKPIAGHPLGGLWRLYRGQLRMRNEPPGAFGPAENAPPKPVSAYESDLDPAAIQLRQSAQWIRYLSSRQLSELAARSPADAAEIQQVKHARFTTPLINLVLLLLGVPCFLNRAPGNILRDGAKCLAICGFCFVFAFACQHMLRTTGGGVPWPAWLPIMVFAPVAIVMLDRVRT